jgi:hypothetical protein
MSRASEEVTWDDQKVTSIDWQTIGRYTWRRRAGDEPCCSAGRTPGHGRRRTATAICCRRNHNAIFDATGARLRQVPFTPERVKAAPRHGPRRPRNLQFELEFAQTRGSSIQLYFEDFAVGQTFH